MLSVERIRTDVDSLLQSSKINILKYKFDREEYDTSPDVLALISFKRFNAIKSLTNIADEFNIGLSSDDDGYDLGNDILDRYGIEYNDHLIHVNFYDAGDDIGLDNPTIEVSMSLYNLNDLFSSYMMGCLLLSRISRLDKGYDRSEPNVIVPKLSHYRNIVKSSIKFI